MLRGENQVTSSYGQTLFKGDSCNIPGQEALNTTSCNIFSIICYEVGDLCTWAEITSLDNCRKTKFF